MTIDAIREYCLAKPGKVTEGLPFGDDVVVFKADMKIFLLMPLDVHPQSISVKCDPGLAVELREKYEAVQPGYHLNKKHWNTIVLDGTVPTREIRAMIDRSFELVAGSSSRRSPDRQQKKKRRRTEA